MVAAQVMKCLWVASLAVAAPQLDFGAQRSVLTVGSAGLNNQQQIVSSVVSTLQPAIAKAVAAALRSSSSTQTVSTRGLKRPAVSNRAVSNYVEEENYGPAQYNYEYKVADKQEQTFITQKEEREGDLVTGKYSYVDPHGDLVTVNYEAGPEGYTAFTDTKKGFVDVKERKASAKKTKKTKSTGFTKATGATKGVSSSFSSTSSSVNQADLISRIISSLQPQIQSAVSSALSSSSRTTTTFKETPRISAVSNGLEGTFGVGGNSVSIATPEFKIAY